MSPNSKDNRWGRLLISAVVALLLVVADYGVQNISFPLFDDVSLLAWIDQVVGSNKDYFDEEDVTYVNVGKDKALVPMVDEWGDTIGNDVITDRETLLRFLDLATKSDYRYIFMDVRFEEGFATSVDSALFGQIEQMPNVIVATHREVNGYAIADSALLPKAANADYRSTIFSGFSRYEFLQGGRRSVALRMLYDIDSHDISKHWYGYVCDDGSLCYNLKCIPLPNNLFSSNAVLLRDNTIGEEMRYPYLGSMILNSQRYSEDEVIQNLLNDKIVIVGDYDNDLHETYVGELPGPVISFAAYKFLRAGLHKVSVLYVIFLFVFFFLISLTILSIRHVANIFTKGTFWNFILSFLGIGALFFVVKIILYKFFLLSMIMVVPTVIFHLMGNISNVRAFFISKNNGR